MNNLFKKIILILLIICFWSILFSNFSFVEAYTNIQETQTIAQQEEQESLAKNIKAFQTFWQAIYTISWPLIVISWKFMDNDIIYGSFIWMDSLLWEIWNVMRTFANYIIWFILIFSIFTLFLWGKLEQYNPIKIIPQLAIAAVLVNASWFFVWAMIDVANIMTYSLWTLPLQLADESKVKEQSVPKFWIKLQDNSKSPFQVWIMNEDNKLLPFCEYKPLDGEPWKYIAKSDCVFESQWKYYSYNSWGKIDISSLSNPIKGNTFWDIQEKLWWMTWVLWTMYASLINIWQTVSYPSWSSVAMLWDLIFKLFFLVALIIPLLTLAIILIVRAVFLWMFIIISPIIFLFTPIKNLEKVLWEKWKLMNLVSLIFLPVVVVFALSISFVFLSYLKFDKNSINDTFWVELEWSKAVIPLDGSDGDNKVTISYKWDDSASLFANLGSTFAWIIQSIFAIAFMWIIVFSAFKTSKLTSWIAQSINRFSVNMAKAAPVVPMAGWQSISSLGQWLWQVKDLPRQRQSEQYSDKLNPLIEEIQSSMTWAESTNISTANNSIKDNNYFNNIPAISWYKTSIQPTIDNTNETIETLLQDANVQKLKEISASLNITTSKLRDILESQQDQTKSLNEIFDDIKDDLENAYIELTKKSLKNIIDKEVKNKNITLLQLNQDSKDKLREFFAKVWITITDLWQNDQTIKALKDLGFKRSEIIKLLSKDLQWSYANSSDEETIWAMIDNLN